MKIVVDDILGRAQQEQVEAVVKAALAGEPGSDDLFLSVVRVKSGRWNVFIRSIEQSQWSVLPADKAPLALVVEEAMAASGI